MSGQLSMDVGRWFGNGPRYVSAPCLTACDSHCMRDILYAETCKSTHSFRKAAHVRLQSVRCSSKRQCQI